MIFNSSYAGQTFAPRGNILSSRYSPLSMPTQSHPCNGMGGESCQCGGGCNERPIQTTSWGYDFADGRTNFYPKPTLNPAVEFFRANEYLIRLDKNGLDIQIGKTTTVNQFTPKGFHHQLPNNELRGFIDSLDSAQIGNSFIFSAEYPTGVIESVRAEVNDTGDVTVKIIDSYTSQVIFDITYYRYQTVWRIGNSALEVKPDTNLLQFAVGAWIASYTARSSVLNFQKNIDSIEVEKYQPKRNTLPVESCSETTTCIAHDLSCSFPQVPIPQLGFTGPKIGILNSDKKTINFVGFPCVGIININIGKCCFAHDIEYWCAKNKTDKDNADTKVAECIANAVTNGILNAYNNFWSIACMVALSIFVNPFTALLTVLDLGLVYLQTFIAIRGILEFVFPRGDLLGYNGQGHEKSCLCGGVIPTTPCPGNYAGTDRPGDYDRLCRDLCKEAGAYEDCYDYRWKCLYKDGKLIGGYQNGVKIGNGPVWDMGPLDKNGLPLKKCCPGTDMECRQDPFGLKTTCPTCDHCDWTCTKQNARWGFVHAPTENGLPCCNSHGGRPCPPPHPPDHHRW